jgi:ribosome-binding factor A
MTFRKQQIESTLKRAVSQVLSRGLSDPRIAGLVSVTRLEVSPDLHDAYVYVSVIPDKYQKRTLAGLRHASPFIHSLVFKAVDLKGVPRLDFRLDTQIKKEAAVLGAIRRAMANETEAAEARAASGDNPGDAQPAGGAGGDAGAQAASGDDATPGSGGEAPHQDPTP